MFGMTPGELTVAIFMLVIIVVGGKLPELGEWIADKLVGDDDRPAPPT